MTWRPTLPDGRRMLYIISNNDLNPNLSAQIFAFAIAPTLINYQPQVLPGPLFPRDRLRKFSIAKKNSFQSQKRKGIILFLFIVRSNFYFFGRPVGRFWNLSKSSSFIKYTAPIFFALSRPLVINWRIRIEETFNFLAASFVPRKFILLIFRHR